MNWKFGTRTDWFRIQPRNAHTDLNQKENGTLPIMVNGQKSCTVVWKMTYVNSTDSDRTALKELSDEGLHCLRFDHGFCGTDTYETKFRQKEKIGNVWEFSFIIFGW